MNIIQLILSFLLFTFRSPSITPAVTAHDTTPGDIKGIFIVNAEDRSFNDLTLKIKVFKSNPLLADAPATLIEEETITGINHKKGDRLEEKFEIGNTKEWPIDDKFTSFYVTVSGYSKNILGKESYLFYGACQYRDLCRVYAHGAPTEITFVGRLVD